MKIALLGGTFNPIHLGHILIAENALRSLHLDKIFFIPCFIPPHKGEDELLEGKHRQIMVNLAIADNPQFESWNIEIERGGTSYTIDTVRRVQAKYPLDQIYFIVGSDNFEEIGHWHRFSELIRCCEFLVIERPGYPLKFPPSSVDNRELPFLRYKQFEGPTLSISSSEIRSEIRKRKNVSHLLSPAVYEYIQTHQLYLNRKAS